ncbi:MAG: hypothetical protein K8R74_00970 [Bacteroidales bacterium]|nr:hypothetical protein [Bacteroidales bacterium]
MKKIIPIVVIILSLTSCIEIREEIHINKDKSGSLSYKLESSQLGVLFKKLSGLIDITIEDQLKEKTEELAFLLKQKDGISHVEFNIDNKTMDYELKCDFSDTKKLNEALYDVFGYKKTFFSPSYLKVSTHAVKKINFSPMLKKYLEDEGIEIPSEYLSEVIFFKSTIHLPKKVKNAKGSQMKIINEKNMVNQKFRLSDVIENKVNVGIKLRY